MSRGLTSPMVSQVTAAQLRPVIFVKAEFDSGDLRLWTGVGDITFNSETYTGAGNFLGISEIREVTGVEAQGATFSLTGVNSSILSVFLSEEIQGRPISCWFGTLDDTLTIVTDPILMFRGRMDVPQINENGTSATIGVQAESRLIDLNRPRVRRYTPEDQKQQYAGDLGCDFVASLQELEVTWGKGAK